MVQARVLEKIFSAILDLHQWNFRMLLTVVDRKEYILLYSHCFCTLYECNFSFPIYLNWTSVLRIAFILQMIIWKWPCATGQQNAKTTSSSLFWTIYAWASRRLRKPVQVYSESKVDGKIIQKTALTVFIGSSGRPVAQSITVWTPTNVAGIVSGLLKSACSETFYIQDQTKVKVCVKHQKTHTEVIKSSGSMQIMVIYRLMK